MAKTAPKKTTEELYAWDAEKRQGGLLLCGVDEAGRGPLAGDVYAAAVILDPSRPLVAGLNDSKKMTEKKRDALFEEVKSACLAYCVASASVEEIETLNILGATMLAMQRAVAGLSMQPGLVLIDGNRLPQLSVPAETVVKGDATSRPSPQRRFCEGLPRPDASELDEMYPHVWFCKAQGLRDKSTLVRRFCSTDHVRRIAPVFCESYIRIMKMKTTEIGRLGETEVCRRLEQLGYSIVKRNFCIRGGEIDIIAQNAEYLAFVEVKTRKPGSLTSGFDDVTVKKQARLIQAVAMWCAEHPTQLQPRFDIACVEMQGTTRAFGGLSGKRI